jgi:hypothetical protein
MHDNPFLDPGDIPETLNAPDHSALYDVPRITAILQTAARESRWVSYSELLMALGFRFTRPKMRVVCKTLATVDAHSILRGEPPLAVLVVRESDGLPGQGWWVDRPKGEGDYQGEWTGAAARAYVDGHQSAAFTYWANRKHRS